MLDDHSDVYGGSGLVGSMPGSVPGCQLGSCANPSGWYERAVLRLARRFVVSVEFTRAAVVNAGDAAPSLSPTVGATWELTDGRPASTSTSGRVGPCCA